jgi:muramoyltetrapeptide carboxypeptidase
VARWTEPSGVPVLGDLDCGHADPMLTLPLGVRARLDTAAGALGTLEAAVTGG